MSNAKGDFNIELNDILRRSWASSENSLRMRMRILRRERQHGNEENRETGEETDEEEEEVAEENGEIRQVGGSGEEEKEEETKERGAIVEMSEEKIEQDKVENDDEFEEERVRMEMQLENIRQRIAERTSELKKMHETEQKNQIIIDTIFEIDRIWNDIEFDFSQLIGINLQKEALKSANTDNRIVKRVRESMLKRGKYVSKLHDLAKEKVSGIMGEAEQLLDYVELGRSSNQRAKLMLVLRCINNIEFWTLENEKTIDEELNRIKPKIDEVRDHLRLLFLDQLKPRVSVRQMIREQLDLEEPCPTLTIRSVCFI